MLFLLTIVVYTIFHVTEETLGNFPRFMQQNWGIPDIGYGQWLYHNMVFFLPVLLVGLLVYLIDEEKFFPFGLAIPVWGVLNFIEHTFYSIKNWSVSPGFYSSILFVIVFFSAVYAAREQQVLTKKRILLSVAVSVSYWAVSLLLVILLSGKAAPLFSMR